MCGGSGGPAIAPMHAAAPGGSAGRSSADSAAAAAAIAPAAGLTMCPVNVVTNSPTISLR
jgi:hypothetical protein